MENETAAAPQEEVVRFIEFRKQDAPRLYLRIGRLRFMWWSREPWWNKLEIASR